MIDETFALRYELARAAFDRGEFIEASRTLEDLMMDLQSEQTDPTGEADPTHTPDGSRAQVTHGTSELRLLLARAYYHSAALSRAERVLDQLVVDEPTDGYARLLLARTLQRQGRATEATPQLAIAAALGQDVSSAQRG